MLKAEQVPDEAMNALLRALLIRKSGKEALAAALNAWPDSILMPAEIILPLPQDASDE